MGSNFPNHELTSNYLTQLQSILVTDWHLSTDLNLTFDITNLPTGQLVRSPNRPIATFQGDQSATLFKLLRAMCAYGVEMRSQVSWCVNAPSFICKT
ncbi:MAG: hypothetical protein H0U45_03230 [Tatlockia sp.]|nr:hypothetical protein [Tatlockia sp.]